MSSYVHGFVVGRVDGHGAHNPRVSSEPYAAISGRRLNGLKLRLIFVGASRVASIRVLLNSVGELGLEQGLLTIDAIVTPCPGLESTTFIVESFRRR